MGGGGGVARLGFVILLLLTWFYKVGKWCYTSWLICQHNKTPPPIPSPISWLTRPPTSLLNQLMELLPHPSQAPDSWLSSSFNPPPTSSESCNSPKPFTLTTKYIFFRHAFHWFASSFIWVISNSTLTDLISIQYLTFSCSRVRHNTYLTISWSPAQPGSNPNGHLARRVQHAMWTFLQWRQD